MKDRLAELKQKLQARVVLAVTLESGRMAVDVLRREGEGSRVVRSFSLPIGSEQVVADPTGTGADLAAQLAANSVRERRCVVCIPAGWALTTSTDVPAVGDDDLRGYLELRAEREFPIPVADLRLAHSAYALPDGSKRATLAAVPTKRMNAVETMLQAAGCRAVSISLGLDGCVFAPETPPSLHFLANGNHVDVVVATGGGIAGLRSLPVPGENSHASFDLASFSREVRITLGRLPETVRQQVNEARFGGGTASAENLCAELRHHLQRMGIDSRLERQMHPTGSEHGAAAVEAAVHHLRQETPVFEFLPPQVNKWQTILERFDSKRRRTILAIAAGLVVLPILVFFVRSRIESSLTKEWTKMRSTVADLETLQERIRLFRPWFDPNPQHVQILQAVVEAFPEQPNVWAKSFVVNAESQVTCTGFAKNQSAVLGVLEELRTRPNITGLQLQQVRGENPVQFTFTFKWGNP